MVLHIRLGVSASTSFKTGLKRPITEELTKPNSAHPTVTSFLVCHKEVNRVSLSRNLAKEAPMAGLKEEGRLLSRPWSTRTKPSRLGLVLGGVLVKGSWLSVFSTLAIGCVWMAAPLRAQFAYVANALGNNVSAYSIGANGALTPVPGSPFPAGNGPVSVALDPTGNFHLRGKQWRLSGL